MRRLQRPALVIAHNKTLPAHAVEAPLGADHVPPSLDSLLASRLDALQPSERAMLERAGVVGRVFEAARQTARLVEAERLLNWLRERDAAS